MRWTGKGTDLWHARVDLIAPDDAASRVSPTHQALVALLTETDGLPGRSFAGVDQGIGVEGQPVLGLTFWVQADDVGAAATSALETARLAASGGLAGPDYYDVVLVPRSAVVLPLEEHAMRMPD